MIYSDKSRNLVNGEALPFRPHMLYVGGAGNVAVTDDDDITSIFHAVPAGTVLPFSPKTVVWASTTATLIVAVAERR